MGEDEESKSNHDMDHWLFILRLDSRFSKDWGAYPIRMIIENEKKSILHY